MRVRETTQPSPAGQCWVETSEKVGAKEGRKRSWCSAEQSSAEQCSTRKEREERVRRRSERDTTKTGGRGNRSIVVD